jgi:arylsulfatase A-like enzyme
MPSPNLLFIFTDQQRYTAAGFNGNGVIQTPNLDRFATQGLVVDNAFSSCPLCSPYRGQLLSGRYAHANGVVDNECELRTDIPTLASSLKDGGYRTAYIGKWHLGEGPYPESRRYGFDDLMANNNNHRYYQGAYHTNETGPIAIDGWAPEDETSQAIRYLEEASTGPEPFALILGWGPPHWPYDQYPEEFDVHSPEDIELSRNVPGQSTEFAKREIAHYYNNMAALDHHFGRLTEALNQMGIADNTIVIYTSDHGDHLSAHGYGRPGDPRLMPPMRASKATPFDESCHVPFAIRWPGHTPAGERSDAFINSVDLMPTLLGLCNVDIPEGVQGRNLSPALVGGACDLPDSVYMQNLGIGWPDRTEFTGFWRAVRTNRWLYARFLNNAPFRPWLFDRDSDPDEMKNLADDPEYATIAKEMESRLQEWMRETEDPFETGERNSLGVLKLGQRYVNKRWQGFERE